MLAALQPEALAEVALVEEAREWEEKEDILVAADTVFQRQRNLPRGSDLDQEEA